MRQNRFLQLHLRTIHIYITDYILNDTIERMWEEMSEILFQS